MVLAEVPLWLVHSSESAGGNGILGSSAGDLPSSENVHDSTLGLAKNALGLLENSGRSRKCAIYSVDIHPSGTKLATSGGDGTVKLWSVSSLFSKRRSKFNDEGDYESSEASDSGGDSDMNESEKGGLEEIENEPSRENRVHDLTDLVRRKKGGGTVSPSKPIEHRKDSVKAPPTRPKVSSSRYRHLCTLSAHTGSSVLAVRFSNSGNYLASAGDDAVVCIYARDSNGSTTVGNLTENSTEHWSRIKLCRGHGLDVVGLAWAPDDSHLVSCSLDSETPIIVWRFNFSSNQPRTHANMIQNPYKVLGKGIHKSTVKGVTFDPAGSHFASSGDDPAVCIWRAHDDWGLEQRIDSSSGVFRKWKDENAQSLTSQTLFRRLSWSTDGTYICSTNCVVKNKHVASTISRDGWKVSTSNSAAVGAADLVGHRQPVVVSRHCSMLLGGRKQNSEIESESDEDELQYGTLVALGDRHGFVTVWSTRKSRPIFKLQCSESRCTVTDLTWGKADDGLVLVVSLLDGHVAALRFSVPDEIGPLW